MFGKFLEVSMNNFFSTLTYRHVILILLDFSYIVNLTLALLMNVFFLAYLTTLSILSFPMQITFSYQSNDTA